MSDLSIIHGKKAVGDICYLLKRFLPSSNFKEILVINQEITFQGMFHIMIYLQLAVEQSLPLITLIHHRTQRMH